MIVDLAPRCSCGRQLAKVPGLEHAVETYRRTCRKCGTTWRVLVRPLASKAGVHVHELTLREIPASNV